VLEYKPINVTLEDSKEVIKNPTKSNFESLDKNQPQKKSNSSKKKQHKGSKVSLNQFGATFSDSQGQ
jgi:hypothetical protein